MAKANCAKCKTNSQKEGTIRVEGGEKYYFCSFCSLLLDKLPSFMVKIFLDNDFTKEKHSDLSLVEWEILKARERRATNIKIWES